MAQVPARPISVVVRPAEVSHLCFETTGILDECFVELGAVVPAFDFKMMYHAFRTANTAGAVDLARLRYDADGIDEVVLTVPAAGGNRVALACLRAEITRAALNKAARSRANTYITKYGDAAGITALLKSVYTTKAGRLTRLSEHTQRRTDQLMVGYEKDGRTGVVKGQNATISYPDVKSDAKSTTKHAGEPDQTQTSSTTTAAIGGKPQVSNTTDVEYRVPYQEMLMQHERNQIAVTDEAVSHARTMVGMERMEEVFQNELASIDADVNQLQVAYLNTILMSPIGGIVTGVYKSPGELVGAGEPVIRVENNDHVLIVATVSCRGSISIGSMVQLTTKLFDVPSSPVTVEAEIVAARSAGDDDQWEIVAKRQNTDNAGNGPLFPLGYTFDYDNTEVSIYGAGEI